jgi:ribonuclease III
MFEKFRSYFHTPDKEIAPEHKDRINKLERIAKIKVGDPFLYLRALRHRSILADDSYMPSDSYERLEFLGDAVLDLIVTEVIFERFPEENEGFLTKLRAKLVRGDSLARYAKYLELHSILVVGERARGQGIEFSKSVLSDVFEALVGAIYIDQGYEKAAAFVKEIINNRVDFDEIVDTLDNHKSLLLEYAQAHKLTIPVYEVVRESGPGHDKTFVIRVLIGEEELGTGTGKSKKEAEQKAARNALKQLQ